MPDVTAFLQKIQQLKLLVLGDLMLDEYLWGVAERISPEAPVQVVDVRREDLRLGGAGNVVRNLIELGAQVCVAGAVGDDGDGALLQGRLQQLGADCSGLLEVSGRITGRKTRVLASNQQMLRIDRESRQALSQPSADSLAEQVEALLPEVDAVLLSDYGKGVLTDRLLRRVIDACRAKQLPVLVDPKGTDYRRYRGATLLTPNRKEAQEATGIAITDNESLLRAGDALLHDVELDALVLTRSEEGMSIFCSGESVEHLPTRAREVFDVSGAGDTVLVVVGLGLAAGLGVGQAARLANMAAGIVVGKVGASTVSPEELAAAGTGYPGLQRKILNREQLGVCLTNARQQKRRIVFTNGCFDLLHAGHVQYLQKARSLGDLLVLGLNSDASVQRLKGEKRPLIGEQERAHILAALDCIDYVTLFDEDTPLELIEAARPDILVKGGDYTPDGVVGREIVENNGGRVEIISFVPGKSTTNIVEKVLRAYQE